MLWSRDHRLETRVHSSSFCPGLSLGLETVFRYRSRDLKSKVSVLVSRLCSGIGLETWSPRSPSWSQDCVQVSVSRSEVQGLRLGLETVFRSWSRDRKSKVSVLVSRSKKGLDNNTGKDSLSHSTGSTVRSWSRSSAVSPQVTEAIKVRSTVGCNYLPSSTRLPSQPLSITALWRYGTKLYC